ncbi:hypothetical protein SprV_0200758500 [Sparganum proliferum]
MPTVRLHLNQDSVTDPYRIAKSSMASLSIAGWLASATYASVFNVVGLCIEDRPVLGVRRRTEPAERRNRAGCGFLPPHRPGQAVPDLASPSPFCVGECSRRCPLILALRLSGMLWDATSSPENLSGRPSFAKDALSLFFTFRTTVKTCLLEMGRAFGRHV